MWRDVTEVLVYGPGYKRGESYGFVALPVGLGGGLKHAELCVVEEADHSFKVPKRAALFQDKVDAFVLDQVEAWLRRLVA